MDRIVNYGIVRKDGKSGKGYVEGVPFEDGKKVVVLGEEDFNLIVKGRLNGLLSNPIDMHRSLYDVSQDSPPLPDEIVHRSPDGTENRLFLDRTLYSLDPQNCIFVRWTSVDLVIRGEGH